MLHTRHPLWLALLGALLSPSAPAAPAPEESEIDAIIVTATKRETPVADVPGTATVLDREQLDDAMADDIKEALRYEPGISVRNEVGRFGLAGFNIRGLEGNRVAIEVDGIRQPDAFAIGDFSNASRDGVDLDLVKRIEIVRGAASSLYGSSALGGIVAFTSKEAGDYLREGADLGAGLNLHADGANEGVSGNFAIAGRHGTIDSVLILSRRESQETENHGDVDAPNSTRTLPNPQDLERTSALLKFGWQADAARRFELAAEHSEFDIDTEVLSGVRRQTTGPTTIDTLSLIGSDQQDRDRLSLDAEFGTVLGFDALYGLAYVQQARTTQFTRERRNTLSGSTVTAEAERDRSFLFDQHNRGLELTGHKSFSAGTSEHYLIAGVDLVETDTEQLRDGLQRNLRTGAVSTVVGPDSFPVRDFPLANSANWPFTCRTRSHSPMAVCACCLVCATTITGWIRV